MNPSKKTVALLLCVFFALAVLVSSALIIHEAGHDCAGEDCPVCSLLENCKETARKAGGVCAVTALILGILTLSVRRLSEQCEMTSFTPVGAKVRSNR